MNDKPTDKNSSKSRELILSDEMDANEDRNLRLKGKKLLISMYNFKRIHQTQKICFEMKTTINNNIQYSLHLIKRAGILISDIRMKLLIWI